MIHILQKIVSPLLILLAVLGISLGLFLYFLHISRFYYAIIFILPLLIYRYILLNEKFGLNINNRSPQKRSKILITIICFLLLTSMNVLFFFNGSFFGFIYMFFILSVLIFGILTYQIIEKKFYYPLIFIEIILFGLILRIQNFFSYNGIIGIDPHYHMGFINEIITNSKIPSGELYSFFPLFHLEIADIAIINELNLKISYFFISLLQLICVVLFVYLIGRQLCNSNVGLLGSLIASISPAILENNITIVPSTLAVVFFIILVFLIFSNKIRIFLPLLLFFTIILILTHHLSSFIFMIWLFIGTILFLNFFTRKENQFFWYFILTLIFLIFYWSVAFDETISGSQFFFDSLINTLRSVLLDRVGGSEVQLEKVYNTSIPFQNIFFIDSFNLIGLSLLITGVFLSLEKKIDLAKFGIITTLMALFVLGASTLGISQIIPQRWFYFINCIAAIPIAYTLFRTISINRRSTYFIGFACILLIGSLGMMHPYATIVNPIIQDDNLSTRLGFTDSELAASCFINLKNTNNPISTDLVYASEISTPSCSPSLKKPANVRYLYPPDKSSYWDGLSIIRMQNTYYSGAYSSGISPVIVDAQFFNFFRGEYYNEIYSNANVGIFPRNKKYYAHIGDY